MQRTQDQIWALQVHKTIIDVAFSHYFPMSIPRERQQIANNIFSDIAVFIYLPRNAIYG